MARADELMAIFAAIKDAGIEAVIFNPDGRLSHIAI